MTGFLARKSLTGLVPVDEAGREALARFPLGSLVRVDTKQPRNLAHFRKYWALISTIYQNQTRYRSPEELSDALKVHIGHCELMTLRDGTEVRRPKSIAFGSMPQEEFNIFYERIIDAVCTEIIPRLDKEDLRRELMEFAA